MLAAFLPPVLPAYPCTRVPSAGRCGRAPQRAARGARMSVHVLRPGTVGWVLPVLPDGGQMLQAGGVDWALLAAGLVLGGAPGGLVLLAAAAPGAQAVATNARARALPHAALLLGTIEGDRFREGARALRVPPHPDLHGAPAAAFVFSGDPSFHPAAPATLHQVYVPGTDEFLLSGDRVRRDRLRELVRAAYNAP